MAPFPRAYEDAPVCRASVAGIFVQNHNSGDRREDGTRSPTALAGLFCTVIRLQLSFRRDRVPDTPCRRTYLESTEERMPTYKTEDIRNISLIGHGSSGKTTLADVILHVTGATNRKGSVNDKTSLMDFEDEEKDRGYSVDSSVATVSHNGKTINIIDTPGAPDFTGTAIASLAAVETAVCVISASEGIGVNTPPDDAVCGELRSGPGDRHYAHRFARTSTSRRCCRCCGRCTARRWCRSTCRLTAARSVVDCLRSDSGDVDFEDVGDAAREARRCRRRDRRRADGAVSRDRRDRDREAAAGRIEGHRRRASSSR